MCCILDDCLKKYGRMCPSTVFPKGGVIQSFDAHNIDFVPISDKQSVSMATCNLRVYCNINLQFKSRPEKQKDVSPVLLYLR
jgi:hypothetical protein